MLIYGALAAASFIVGALIGTVGIGGILLIPALVWISQVPIHTASATALFTFALTGAIGTYLYARRGSIDWPAGAVLCAGALAFSFLGAYVNSLVDAVILDRIIGAVILFGGMSVLIPFRRDATANGGTARWALLLAVGAAAGFGSGLTGAGGPLFSVPMMLTLGFAPLMTIGVSQVLQLVSAISGSVANFAFGSIDLAVAALVIPFEVVGIVVGVGIAHRADVRQLRVGAAVLCIVTGAFILLRSR